MSGKDQRSRLDLLHGRSTAHSELIGRMGLRGPVWGAADHVVTLTRRGDDPSLLGARFGTTGRDPYLWLATQADAAATRRMLSALLLRLATDEDLPAALIIHRRDSVLMEVAAQLAETMPGAVLYPRVQETVVPLRTAAMMRRIARTIGLADIVILDLRSVDESMMTPAMTRMTRARAG